MNQEHKILVVHEDRDVLEIFRLVFEFEGFSVDYAQDIKQGIEHAQSKTYSLIFLGQKLKEHAKFLKTPKILYISDWCKNCSEPNNHVTRPLSAEEILEKTKKNLNL